MACAHVPLDEQQVTESGPLGKEVTLPALVSQRTLHHIIFIIQMYNETSALSAL